MRSNLRLHVAFLVFVSWAYSSSVEVDCTERTDCLSCAVTPKTGDECAWCPSQNQCLSFNNNKTTSFLARCPVSSLLRYDDQCTVDLSSSSSPFYSDWMGSSPLFADLTLLDLTLPGSHDTLTYDLSLKVSDGGIDNLTELAAILHDFNHIVPNGIEDYIVQQAQTQDLTITEQLDSGLRFFDIRIIYEYTDKQSEWYSVHFMQSVHPAIVYLQQIAAWMHAHPTEVVVLWLSKHGSPCVRGDEQYPNTTIAEKQAFWSEILTVFGGLVVDTRVTKVNETRVGDMVARNHRVVFYASDYVEFTGSSPYALDGCSIDNFLGPGVSDEVNALSWELSTFASAAEKKRIDKQSSSLMLMSMATGVPSAQMAIAARIRFLGDTDKATERCARVFNIPGFDWCPPTLLDIGNLENYYQQISLEAAYNGLASGKYSFPNAIYINAVDVDGTIRTGTQVLWGANRTTNEQDPHATTSYAYAATLIGANVFSACRGQEDSQECVRLNGIIAQLRAQHPASYWDDAKFGRHVEWPSRDGLFR